METLEIAKLLDDLLKFENYPDSIVDIVRQTDITADSRFRIEYLNKSSGLMLCNGADCKQILCAVFPSQDAFDFINSSSTLDSLLFVKHPMDWDEFDKGFVPMTEAQIQSLEERNVSLYSAHAPIDNNKLFSPSYKFAEQFGFEVNDELVKNGRNYGYVLNAPKDTDYEKLKELIFSFTGLRRLQEHFHHNKITRIAVVSGGGDDASILDLALEKQCDTYLTGILYFRGSNYAKDNNPQFIRQLRKSGLNAFGVSHYLTEIAGIREFAKYVSSALKMTSIVLSEEKKSKRLINEWGMIV